VWYQVASKRPVERSIARVSAADDFAVIVAYSGRYRLQFNESRGGVGVRHRKSVAIRPLCRTHRSR
jgi:hypothetical protein